MTKTVTRLSITLGVVAAMLIAAGCGGTKVYDLDGGIRSWEEKKLELENYNLPIP